jgi:hypothetical protein
METTRTFKVKFNNNADYEGRYTGKNPRQAASKALSQHLRGKKNGKVTIMVKETTQGSNKKEYTYIGERVKLTPPVVYDVAGGKQIVRKYVNKIRSA